MILEGHSDELRAPKVALFSTCVLLRFPQSWGSTDEHCVSGETHYVELRVHRNKLISQQSLLGSRVVRVGYTCCRWWAVTLSLPITHMTVTVVVKGVGQFSLPRLVLT